MAADLTLLDADFRKKVEQLLAACREQDVVMRPFFTVRTPLEQAKLWRQSRTKEHIDRQIKAFEDAGAPYLAECLCKAGPQSGKWATDALPGASWHNWLCAVDCVWIVRGVADWTTPDRSPKGTLNGYQVYADLAKELQLTPLGPTRLADWVHCQAHAHKVTDQYSWEEIDAEMMNRFERVPY